MKGIYLKFFVLEKQMHQHLPVYEWLLEHARKSGIRGGSAFRAMAGFGRHHKLHEDHFFELQGDLPVEIVFAVSSGQAERFLADLRKEGLDIFYIRTLAEFEMTLSSLEDKTGPISSGTSASLKDN
ncbi:MAG: DUF190 domain-containing protein [Proteobacteria bacterium]|nr:DUF190 domain-containing protein [Pseudomonadota bacterium]